MQLLFCSRRCWAIGGFGNYLRSCSEFAGPVGGCEDDVPTSWLGEDKDLDGVLDLDKKETSPLKWSTADDGVSDLQRYYNCLLTGANDC